MSRPMAITEKILAKAGRVDHVEPGDVVNAKVDLVYTMDFLGKVLYTHMAELGAKHVFDDSKVVVIFDHYAPPPNVQWAEVHQWIRGAVKQYGGTLYDIGRHGVMHQIIVENGHIRPGTLAIGTDSHAPTGGALGAVVVGIGASDAAIAMASGEVWLAVPESVKVVVKGKMPLGVMSRDMMFRIMGEKGWDGGRGEWAYKAIEFTGETIKRMDMSSRLTTTNLVSDLGAKNGIIEPDNVTIRYLKGRTKEPFKAFRSDPGAAYSEEYKIDVSRLEPQVACPHSPDNVKPIKEVEGTKIDMAAIGSCTNARIDDLSIAARILKGRKVHPGTRMLVSPASTSIFSEALRKGIVQVLSDAGAIVANCGCGPCLGAQLAVLAPGEVCITSTPRNMEGRMGSPKAQIYSANPATVAASAVEGAITDPRKFLRRR